MTTIETRNQILQTAGQVFAENGYKKATVREICSKAKVNVAAVNYHFGDKERLYIEAVKNARRLIEQDVPLPEFEQGLPPGERFQVFVSTLVHRLLHKKAAPWQHKLLVREIMEPTKACEEMVQESFGPFFEMLVATISEIMPSGVPSNIIRKLGFSVIAQCVFYRAHNRIAEMLISAEDKDFFQPEDIAEHITRFSLAAINTYSEETLFCHEK